MFPYQKRVDVFGSMMPLTMSKEACVSEFTSLIFVAESS